MSAAWPSPLERACPKCGMLQESPGSTVCEQCGADLVRANVGKPSVPRAPLQLGRILRSSRHLLRQGVAGVLLLVSLAFRTVKVFVVLSVFIVGLSFVSEINARVPIMKDVAATANVWIQETKWIQQAETWGRGNLASLWQGIELLRRPSSPAVAAKKAALTKPAAAQPLTLKSSPSGATVKLNTRIAGKTPMILKLTPGTYKVTVSRPGYATVTRTVVVKPGRAASLNLTLTAAPRPAPQTAPIQQTTPVPQPPPTRIRGEDP